MESCTNDTKILFWKRYLIYIRKNRISVNILLGFNVEVNFVFCGDCKELLNQLDNNSVQLFLTSPPYNKEGLRGKTSVWTNWKKSIDGIKYDVYEDNMKEDEFQQWQIELLNIMYDKLKDIGSVFYNHKVRRKDNSAVFPDFVFKTKFMLHQIIIWDRKTSADQNDNYLIPTTEYIFWLKKGNNPICNKNDCCFKTEVWSINPEKNNPHPAPFPKLLATELIKLGSNKGDLVIDPFGGSGTTAVAAIDTKRDYIIFEINRKYCDLTEKRIKNALLLSKSKLF